MARYRQQCTGDIQRFWIRVAAFRDQISPATMAMAMIGDVDEKH